MATIRLKLDMIYERVEQINYEINAKLYDLENNILYIIHDSLLYYISTYSLCVFF